MQHSPLVLRTPLLSAALGLGLVAALAAAPVLAESACKGLEQGACEGSSDCTWIEGYTRKDGIDVSSHCKSKGKRSVSPQAKSTEGEKDSTSSKE